MAVTHLRHALERGRGVRVHMYQLGHRHGFWNLLSLHPGVDLNGEVRYYAGLGVGITRRQLKQIVDVQAEAQMSTHSCPQPQHVLAPLAASAEQSVTRKST